VFSISATYWILVSSWIALIKDHILRPVSFLDEPLPNFIADDEKVSLNMGRGHRDRPCNSPLFSPKSNKAFLEELLF
jgi:hypothetical protein